jgi:hypothetical protein
MGARNFVILVPESPLELRWTLSSILLRWHGDVLSYLREWRRVLRLILPLSPRSSSQCADVVSPRLCFCQRVTRHHSSSASGFRWPWQKRLLMGQPIPWHWAMR